MKKKLEVIHCSHGQRFRPKVFNIQYNILHYNSKREEIISVLYDENTLIELTKNIFLFIKPSCLSNMQ